MFTLTGTAIDQYEKLRGGRIGRSLLSILSQAEVPQPALSSPVRVTPLPDREVTEPGQVAGQPPELPNDVTQPDGLFIKGRSIWQGACCCSAVEPRHAARTTWDREQRTTHARR